MTISRSALGVLALTAAVAAQQPTPPTFHTEANYVRVDVYPTTADGKPVLDLRQDDFDLLENGKPQTPVQFEHVVIRGQSAHDTRPDPNTVAESRSMMQESRARLFALFLDDKHVEVSGSHDIRKPLTDTLERLIGPDDLFGVMIPEMAATQVTFARKTTTIDGILSHYWDWGERGRITTFDPVEQQYNECYPGYGPDPQPGGCKDDDRGVAAEMILRRREIRTLDALEDLARYLRGVREERKAVLVVSDGWRLYRPDSNLARRLYCDVPSGSPTLIGPGGKLEIGQKSGAIPASHHTCDQDRLNLAQIDDQVRFRRIFDEANRANVSFYPIDPRGLPVFDSPMGPGTPLPPTVDAAQLLSRSESLRTLAEATDGLAIVESNDLDKGMRRIVDDLSSYYLLGYYSTGKLDGQFHKITVRVKRPGVNVRARRGYLAPTQAEVDAARITADAEASGGAGLSEAAAEARAIDDVVAPLAGLARALPIRLQAVAGWKPDKTAAVWAVGEVAPSDDWKPGGEADITLTNAAGAVVVTTHARVEAGAHTFRVVLASLAGTPLAPGDYAVRIRARGDGPSAITLNDVVRLGLPQAPDESGAIFVRRGPSTGNKEVPTADLRFRRSERIRVEVPNASPGTSARLLDRTGKALAVPLASGVREDADGSRWQTAELALAPLAMGDYVVEFASGGAEQKRTLAAFRVIP